jgi:hypothetical protein
MNIEDLLEDYRNADDDRRLGLFLAHRELREAFAEVDRLPKARPERSRATPIWERLQVLEAGGSERHPESARLPRGRTREIAALVITALIAGGALRLLQAAGAAARKEWLATPAATATWQRNGSSPPAPSPSVDGSP